MRYSIISALRYAILFRAYIVYPICLCFLLIACDDHDLNKSNTSHPSSADQYEQKSQFAKALAAALQANRDLRDFIRSKALEKFDNDYDLLYALVKDEAFSNGQTLRNELLKHFSSESILEKIESDNPLLTIYVPELPSNFSAKTWNTADEIPRVAFAVKDKPGVSVFNANGHEMTLTVKEIPGFPVVVIKDNERIVRYQGVSPIKNSSVGRTLCRDMDGFAYSFSDESFDGSIQHREPKARTYTNGREWYAPGIPIDPKVLRARDLGIDWHRDHVYYDLQPGTNRGKFDNRYKEYITEIKFDYPSSLGVIADADIDPKPKDWKWAEYDPSWTDGVFEIRINVLINAKNGVGQVIQKILPIRPDQLFFIEYERRRFSIGAYVYIMKSVRPVPYWPYKLEVVGWDLNNYGSAWKFTFEEFDLSQTITTQVQHSSKFATNFSYDVGFGEDVKVGYKFGASSEETTTQTYTVVTMVESDKLGECVVDFGDQIITHFLSSPAQTFPVTYEYGAGHVRFSVEPLTTTDPLWDNF